MMRVPAALAVVAVFAASVLLTAVATAQETAQPAMFLRDAAHTGVGEPTLATPLVLEWKHTIDGAGGQRMISSPVCDEDTVYFFVGKSMHAVSRATGAPKWEKTLDLPDTVDATPLIVDKQAVVGCRDGKVYFIDVRGAKGNITGSFDINQQNKGLAKPAATTTATQPTMGMPFPMMRQSQTQTATKYVQASATYNDGTVYVGADDGWVYAINLASKEKEWGFRTNAAIKASPAYWNHGVYVASTDGYLYGLSAKTGKLRWRSKLDTFDNFTSPVVAYSKVFAASGKYLYACDFGSNGYVRWRFEAKDKIVGSPAVYGNMVMFGDAAGKFYGVSTSADGNLKYTDSDTAAFWQVPPEPPADGKEPPLAEGEVSVGGMDKPVKSSPIVFGDVVIYRPGPRQINALSLKDHSLVWHYNLPEDAANATATVSRGFGGRFGGRRYRQEQGSESMEPGAGGMFVPGMGGGMAEPGMGMPFQQEFAPPSFDMGGAPPPGGGSMDASSAEPGGGMGMPFGAGGPGGSGLSGRGGFGGIATTTTQPTGPTLVFENELMASPFVAGNQVFVLGDDGALYCFSSTSADAIAPEFSSPELEIPAQGGSRQQQTLTLKGQGAEGAQPIKINGAPPVYIRVKVVDVGSGINPQSLTVTEDEGGGAKWVPAYDTSTGHVWAAYEGSGRGGGRSLPEGVYSLTFSVCDWSGNQARATVSFEVDYNTAPPAAPRQRGFFPGGGFQGGGMYPGMEGMEGGGALMGPGTEGAFPGYMGPEGGGMGMPGLPGLPGMPSPMVGP
jgi:outer membrane protein assembly factor BamB